MKASGFADSVDEKSIYLHYDDVIWVTSIHREPFDIEGVAWSSLWRVTRHDAQ